MNKKDLNILYKGKWDSAVSPKTESSIDSKFCKISSLGNDLYQIDNNEIPIDRNELLLLKNQSKLFTEDELLNWVKDVNEKGVGEIETTANTGVVVNMYEVDYPQPLDPNKETQELAKHLDEYKDFITQYIYPDSEIKDVLVDLKSDLDDRKANFKRKALLQDKAGDEIYTKLAPSNLGGIGIFTIKDILKGTPVFLFHNLDDEKKLSPQEVKNLSVEERDLLHNHAVIFPDGSWIIPSDYHRLHNVWYLNHSSNFNLVPDENFNWYAVRNIKKGEELTGNYNDWDNEGTGGFEIKEGDWRNLFDGQ